MSPLNEQRETTGQTGTPLPTSDRRLNGERPSAASALRSFVKHLSKKDP